MFSFHVTDCSQTDGLNLLTGRDSPVMNALTRPCRKTIKIDVTKIRKWRVRFRSLAASSEGHGVSRPAEMFFSVARKRLECCIL